MLSTGPIQLPRYDLTENPLGPKDQDSLKVDDIIRFIRRRRRLFLIWVFAALCAGIAFAILSPAYYTATATILLEEHATRPSIEAAGLPPVVDPAYADSQIQVLQSDEVLGRLLDKHLLGEDSGTVSDGIRELLRTAASYLRPELSAASKLDTRHADVLRFKRAVSIRRIGLSNAVEIDFTSQNPLRSAVVANAIAQSYIDDQIGIDRKTREEAASHLLDSLADLRSKAFAVEDVSQDNSPTTPEVREEARARFRELQSKVETYRTIYERLLQRRYMESVDLPASPHARVLSPAQPPTERSWPRMTIVFVAALAGGAFFGLSHALFKQATDHSLTSLEDVQRVSDVDLISDISKVGQRAWKAAPPPQECLQGAYTRESFSLHGAMGRLAAKLLPRQSRSGLTIGVVAPATGAGTSSIAFHLAKVIAESGQKTLLVDANWRKSQPANKVSKSESGPKLTRSFAVIAVGAEKLNVLVLRPTAPISELNASLSIVAALQQLQADYDRIVVDFNSMEQAADLEACMTVLNEVIMVVESHRTSSNSLDTALRLIPRDKIAAVVLNKV